MNRYSFPAGQTSIAKVKALLKYLENVKGLAVAEAWLKATGWTRAEFDDETRQVPLPQVHDALREFVAVASVKEIRSVARYLIAPDNLGVWVRVLRGTTSPQDAFMRLDGVDTEYGRTTRWEGLAAGPGRWSGRVYVAHDPTLEEDGLLTELRAAELLAVPALFGYGDVSASVPTQANGALGPSQEFEVRWSVSRLVPDMAAGIAAGGSIGTASFLAQPIRSVGLVSIFSGLAGGGGRRLPRHA